MSLLLSSSLFSLAAHSKRPHIYFTPRSSLLCFSLCALFPSTYLLFQIFKYPTVVRM